MSFYGRTDAEHVDLILALVVDGVPSCFVTRQVPGSPAALAGRTQIVCVTSVEEGESTLDVVERREVAATLDVDMVDTDDKRLQALFAHASRPVTELTADVTVTATSLTVLSSGVVQPGDVIYVGDETIIVGAVSGTTLSGCTRGALGSRARARHTGDYVYAVPPSWVGRRARLYGYAPDAAGLHSETLLGTYIVDESPRHSGGLRWSLRLAGVVQEYWERVVGLGVEKATIRSVHDFNNSPSNPALEWTITLKVSVGDARKLRTSPTFNAHVLVRSNLLDRDVVGIHRLISVDVANDLVEISYNPWFRTERAVALFQTSGELQQIAVVSSPRENAILAVLLSDEGQGLYASGDRLPGRLPSSSGDLGWRFGAGLRSSEVGSFGEITSIPPMSIIIDGERKLTDVLREWCLLSGAAVVSTADGKIKAVSLSGVRSPSTTITRNDIIPDTSVSVTAEENDISPIVKVSAGYSPITGETSDEITLIDAELAKRYTRTPGVTDVEVRSIDAWEPVPMGPSDGWAHPTRMRVGTLAALMADVLRQTSGVSRRVTMSLHHRRLSLRVGDIVAIGNDLEDGYANLPNMRGGKLAGATCRVVGRRPRYAQGRVDVTLEIMERLLHVCPAAVITAHNGSGTLTLATTTPEVPASGLPARSFWVGAVVRMVDRSSLSGTPVVETAQVTSIPSTTQIVVSPAPTFTVQADVDYVVLDPDASADGESLDKYRLIEHAMLAGDDGVAGTNPAADTNPRWR